MADCLWRGEAGKRIGEPSETEGMQVKAVKGARNGCILLFCKLRSYDMIIIIII